MSNCTSFEMVSDGDKFSMVDNNGTFSMIGGGSGGGGGTTDYARLNNKPSINNVTLEGNKTAEQLGLLDRDDIAELETAVGTKAPAIYSAASGDIASFSDGADDMRIKSLIVNIEPIQSGSGDPSPTNVRPISGHTECNVIRCWKNLLNSATNVIDKGINGSGTIVNSTGARGGNYTQAIKVNAGESYVFSAINEDSGQWTRRLHGYDDNGNWVAQLGYIGDSSGIHVGTRYQISVVVPEGVAEIRASYMKKDIDAQFERGSTASEYESYTATYINVSWQSEAGTVYSGTIDVINGKLTVDKAIVDLGSLTWTKSSNRAFMYSNGIADVVAPPSSQNVAIDGLCTTLPCLMSYLVEQNNQGVCVHTNGNIRVYYDGIPSDANEFKTAVSGWMFLYPLATPIEYQLTGQQMNTLLGYNNIYSDVGGIANIDYPVDTKMYIDNLFASIPTASGVSF